MERSQTRHHVTRLSKFSRPRFFETHIERNHQSIVQYHEGFYHRIGKIQIARHLCSSFQRNNDDRTLVDVPCVRYTNQQIVTPKIVIAFLYVRTLWLLVVFH